MNCGTGETSGTGGTGGTSGTGETGRDEWDIVQKNFAKRL